MKTTDRIFLGVGVGTGVLFAVFARRDENNIRANATLRVGGSAMLLTTLFGDTSHKVRKGLTSAVVIMSPEIAAKASPMLGGLGDLGDARHQLYTMPNRWWMPDASKGLKNCYQNKAEALIRFAEYNSNLIENYSGIAHEESPAEFDAINQRYGLSGNRAVVNIAQALWVSMPPGRPYCLADMAEKLKSEPESRLDTLNRTSPAMQDPSGIGFQIPDFALEDKMNREQMEIWKRQEQEEVRAPRVRIKSSQAKLPPPDEIPF